MYNMIVFGGCEWIEGGTWCAVVEGECEMRIRRDEAYRRVGLWTAAAPRRRKETGGSAAGLNRKEKKKDKEGCVGVERDYKAHFFFIRIIQYLLLRRYLYMVYVF